MRITLFCIYLRITYEHSPRALFNISLYHSKRSLKYFIPFYPSKENPRKNSHASLFWGFGCYTFDLGIS
ncbi:hypothetical protein KP509_14G039600 [Ceratopteris richardii]|nr:hypothetical protein KP509_14G039600 [Ceratopteris richardii]